MSPRLRLDDLLAELQVRLTAAVMTRDRVHALLDAKVTPREPAARQQRLRTAGRRHHDRDPAGPCQ
jgi:hypothetical protein